jgi:hypothetical protein
MRIPAAMHFLANLSLPKQIVPIVRIMSDATFNAVLLFISASSNLCAVSKKAPAKADASG